MDYMDYYDYELPGEEPSFEDYYYDSYGDAPNRWGSDMTGDSEDDSEHLSLNDIVEQCVVPTVSDGALHIIELLIWCFIFRISTQMIAIPLALAHLLCAVTGIVVLYHFFEVSTAYILALSLLAYLTLGLMHWKLARRRGAVLGVVCIIYLVTCELFVVQPNQWHRIRGAQMLLAMKAISVGFDLDSGMLQEFPSVLEYFGYIFCVGTVIFGPWVSYKDYTAIYEHRKWNAAWVLKVILSSAVGMFFLSLSTCWTQWLIPDGSWKWLIAYRDALSFRSSHYFVSFMSEASAMTSGLGWNAEKGWGIPVTRPQHIEVPRSLVEVVVYWNMPMHYWLKTYVFKTTQPYGSFLAVLSTYTASAVLHGLNFQLAAVLFSLGLYTYIEFMLRQKLSNVFTACVMTRECKADCSHTNKSRQFWVIVANIGFGLLTIFHLSYLGVMFETSSQQLEEEGFSFSHTLAKWRLLKYASHWVMAGTYIFYWLI